MAERWYREAVIYSLDVDTFADSDGDGVGDLAGLVGRLDYLARLGVTCLWLAPVHPTPNRDDGYDVTDFYGVDPRIGSLGDFVELVHQCANRGIRVMIDLVVNHTSDEHPWFQAALADRDSRYRDFYVWSEEEPPDRRQGMVFPGPQEETWSYAEQAGAWYYHRFFGFEPDLDAANPAVREEIERILGFWLQLGVAGFRMDAAPFVIELTEPGNPSSPKDFDLLGRYRALLSWRRGDAVILAEANVPPADLVAFFGSAGADGPNDRLPMLFDFLLSTRCLLALARADRGPVVQTLREAPALPAGGQWATFLRNHDEVDLSRLSKAEQQEVFAAFGPEESMQLYGRGIRRRLAPMLGGDQRRIRLAYSLQFTLPGTPVLRYGDEIGMGEDLDLPERNAIRTPMQWSGARNGGFSTAEPDRLRRPMVSGGQFGYERVNVADQRQDPGSLLTWFERMLRTLRECPEVGTGTCEVLDVGPPSVLVHRAADGDGAVLFLHNLCDAPATVDTGLSGPGTPLLADDGTAGPRPDLAGVDLPAYGYRWIRLR